MSDTKEEVHADLRDDIGWIIFDAPGANILTRTAFERLETILTEYKRMSVQTLVFAGARGNFCGGLWLKYVQELQNSSETADDAINYFYKVSAMIREFRTTIAAIENGVCYGIGLEIAGLCDYVVALKKNALTISFGALAIRYGFMLGLGTSWRLRRKMGFRNTAIFLLNRGITDTATACQLHLVDYLLPGDDFDGEVRCFIERVLSGEKFGSPALNISPLTGKERETLILRGPKYAASRTLAALDAGVKIENFEEALALDKVYFKELFLSGDAKNGIHEFLAKK